MLTPISPVVPRVGTWSFGMVRNTGFAPSAFAKGKSAARLVVKKQKRSDGLVPMTMRFVVIIAGHNSRRDQ